MKTWLVVCCPLLFLLGRHNGQWQDFPNGQVIDLTHPFDATTIFWPTEEGFVLEKEFDGFTEKGYYYTANKFRTAEHGGTHIDAPIHFHKGGLTVDQIAPEQLMGKGIIIDVSSKCAGNRDYQVSKNDFVRWESRYGKVPDGAIVLLRTGYGQYWPDRIKYMGTDERGQSAVTKLHFPGLHPDAARWLTEERNIKAIGLDTPSIDYGQSTLFESHRILFSKGVPALENVANLSRLPDIDFDLIALPMKIRGGSGSPLRVIAILARN